MFSVLLAMAVLGQHTTGDPPERTDAPKNYSALDAGQWSTDAILPEDYAKHPCTVQGKELPYREYLAMVVQGRRRVLDMPGSASRSRQNRRNMEAAAAKATCPTDREWWRRTLLLDSMLDMGKIDFDKIKPRTLTGVAG